MCSETGKCDTYTGKMAGNSNCLWGAKILDLADTDFKASIKSMFKELKETMSINFRESMVTMSCPVENISENIQSLKRIKWKYWSGEVL